MMKRKVVLKMYKPKTTERLKFLIVVKGDIGYTLQITLESFTNVLDSSLYV